MISLERPETTLVLAAAIFARNLYGITWMLDEYCEDHDLNREQLRHEVSVMSQPYGTEYLETKRDNRLHLTEGGFAFLINNIDHARDLVVQINDVLAMMALEAPLTAHSQQADRRTSEDAPEPATYPAFEAAFAREESRSTMCRMLRRAYEELDRSATSNAQVAQAKAFIECALLMTECPEPQPDLVWAFCQRASNIAGIGSLILAIITLVIAG